MSSSGVTASEVLSSHPARDCDFYVWRIYWTESNRLLDGFIFFASSIACSCAFTVQKISTNKCNWVAPSPATHNKMQHGSNLQVSHSPFATISNICSPDRKYNTQEAASTRSLQLYPSHASHVSALCICIIHVCVCVYHANDGMPNST